MGFVISYRLGIPAQGDPRELLLRLRRTSRQLPGCNSSRLASAGPSWSEPHVRRAELMATREVLLIKVPADAFTYSLEVDAMDLTAFWFQPGVCCEAAGFGLARYPATVFDPRSGVQVPTELGSGWHWAARFSAVGALALGVTHYLSCHLAVVSLLERAIELGCVATVADETGFWEKRDVGSLARTAAEHSDCSDDFEAVLAAAITESEFVPRGGRLWELTSRLRILGLSAARAC